MKMERQLSKEQILELDLNLSPMGGNIRGAGLAARVYFGKDVENITLPEAAALAALPRSPSRFDPRRPTGRKLLLREKDRILKRMAALGWITREQLKMSLGSTVVFKNQTVPVRAPHFVDLALENRGEAPAVMQTTLDLDVQRGLEQVIRSHRDRLRRMGITQAAALIVSCRSAEVLALVGSFSYSESDQGFNNGVVAQRSAGSTLKPFLYALALEKGYGSIAEISDTDRTYQTPHGDYMPMNADRTRIRPGECALCAGQFTEHISGKGGPMGWTGGSLPIVGSRGNYYSEIRIGGPLWAGIGGGQCGGQSVPACPGIPDISQ